MADQNVIIQGLWHRLKLKCWHCSLSEAWLMHRNFRLLFILANWDYNTHRKISKYPHTFFSWQYRSHEEVGRFTLYIYIYILWILKISHTTNSALYSRTIVTNSHFTILTYVIFGNHVSIKTRSIKFNRKLLPSLY